MYILPIPSERKQYVVPDHIMRDTLRKVSFDSECLIKYLKENPTEGVTLEDFEPIWEPPEYTRL